MGSSEQAPGRALPALPQNQTPPMHPLAFPIQIHCIESKALLPSPTLVCFWIISIKANNSSIITLIFIFLDPPRILNGLVQEGFPLLTIITQTSPDNSPTEETEEEVTPTTMTLHHPMPMIEFIVCPGVLEENLSGNEYRVISYFHKFTYC